MYRVCIQTIPNSIIENFREYQSSINLSIQSTFLISLLSVHEASSIVGVSINSSIDNSAFPLPRSSSVYRETCNKVYYITNNIFRFNCRWIITRVSLGNFKPKFCSTKPNKFNKTSQVNCAIFEIHKTVCTTTTNGLFIAKIHEGAGVDTSCHRREILAPVQPRADKEIKKQNNVYILLPRLPRIGWHSTPVLRPGDT